MPLTKKTGSLFAFRESFGNKDERITTTKKEIVHTSNKRYPVKIGGSQEQNELIKYAFDRCGLDCIRTFEAESGWRYEAKNTKNRNGTYDISYCQLNSQYHSKFIHSKEFKNKQTVLNYCIDVYRRAKEGNRLKTTFYGYNVRNTAGVVRNIPNP